MQFGEFKQILIAAFPGLSAQQQKAARYLLDHPDEVGLNSMRSVAATAKVQPATLSRLARTLGLTGYQALRAPFRERLRSPAGRLAARFRDLSGQADVQALYADLGAAEAGNVAAALAPDRLASLLEVRDLLLGARRLYVLGLRSAYAAAFVFDYTYRMFHDNGVLLDGAAGTVADALRGIGADDALLAISLKPYTQITVEAAGYAAARGAHLVAITDSELSPLARQAERVLIVADRSPSFFQSLTGTIALAQALIALMVAGSNRDALRAIAASERQLTEMGAYWSEPERRG